MTTLAPSYSELIIPETHFKCSKPYCIRPLFSIEIYVSILARTLKNIICAVSRVALRLPKLPRAILSSRVFLFVLLISSGTVCYAETPITGTITPDELSRRLKEHNSPIILDVRTREEYLSGHIDTAVNLSHDELERRFGEIPGSKSDEIIVYCRSGKRARIAENILAEKGYTNVKDLAGHWQGWNGQAK